MPFVHRIFPNIYTPPGQCFSLLLLSEGFTAADQHLFDSACQELVDRLFTTTPFNLTLAHPTGINIYTHFIPSAEPGPGEFPVPRDTPFRSIYNADQHSFLFERSFIPSEIDRIKVRGEYGDNDTPGSDIWPYRKTRYRSAVVILLPAQFGSTPISGELNLISDAALVPYAATSIDGPWWYQVVARVIASALGLGDEWEIGGDSFTTPSQQEGRRIDGRFYNLIYMPGVPEGPNPDFKWYGELSTDARNYPLTHQAVSHPEPVNQPYYYPPNHAYEDDILLVEGGGGYTQHIYRSAHDCLMRRNLNRREPSIKSIKDQYLPFCLICQRHIVRRIQGEQISGISPVKRLNNQKLKFDEVHWGSKTESSYTFASGTISHPIANRTQGQPANQPYWTFTNEINSTQGLVIKDLKLRNQPTTASVPNPGEDIAKLIEFRDLQVTFHDGTKGNFNVSAALASGTAKLVNATDGKSGPTDMTNPAGYLHGLKLTLEDNVDGFCWVRVELSVVLKGESTDFDPGGGVYAVRFYPQIGMTWALGGAKRVSAFRGGVRMVVNHYRDPNELRNVPGLFTDSNTWGADDRLKSWENEIPFPPPINWKGKLPYTNWSFMFDYVRTRWIEGEREIEFVGVYGPGDPRFDKHVPRKYTWPRNSTTNSIELKKFPRQGAYDNTHFHGYMGTDHTGVTMAHAPFCGEACFHLHWRWGPFPASGFGPLGSAPKLFKGWGRYKGSLMPNCIVSAPLIPPNQHLTVAFVNESTVRQSDGSLLGVSPPSRVVAIGKPLHPLIKAVWYTVDVIKPPEGYRDQKGWTGHGRQVILEQGCAFAYAYNRAIAVPLGPLMVYKEDPVKATTNPVWRESRLATYLSDPDVLFHLLYEDIRYTKIGFPPIVTVTHDQQVPEGTELDTTGTVSMEDL